LRVGRGATALRRAGVRRRGGAGAEAPFPRKPPDFPTLSTLPQLPTLRIDPKLPTLSSEAKLPTLSSEAALATLNTLAQLRADPALWALMALPGARWAAPVIGPPPARRLRRSMAPLPSSIAAAPSSAADTCGLPPRR
jgi:hypothetical protein